MPLAAIQYALCELNNARAAEQQLREQAQRTALALSMSDLSRQVNTAAPMELAHLSKAGLAAAGD